MKNCEPFVFGPEFAMARAPRTTLFGLNSSSKCIRAAERCRSDRPWHMKSGITRWKIDAL